ncbi:hypothetical protein [uncultured Roseibium sp.]|uniref:hypothetical protein n=1 Tax=uncultured Roseibium sp. TaxID=1936171 RepID=UPI003216FEA3
MLRHLKRSFLLRLALAQFPPQSDHLPNTEEKPEKDQARQNADQHLHHMVPGTVFRRKIGKWTDLRDQKSRYRHCTSSAKHQPLRSGGLFEGMFHFAPFRSDIGKFDPAIFASFP